MEYTPEEAEKILIERISEYPRIQAVFENPTFDDTVRGILTYVSADPELFPIVRNELLVVLAFYAPYTELEGNIAESTGITREVSSKIVSLLDTLLLSDIRDDLTAFAYLWDAELAKSIALTDTDIDLKERLELRPKGVERNTDTPIRTAPTPPVGEAMKKDGEVTLADMKIIATPGKDGGMEAKKPLTKEEILGALSPHRTMASDIAAVRSVAEPKPGGTPTPIIEHLKAAPQSEAGTQKNLGENNKPVVGYDAVS